MRLTRRRAGCLLLALLAVAGAGRPRALSAQQTSPPAASSPSDLTVYLMTFGPGARVWERFGHNAIWIHDPAHGTDQAYNYGLFDFAQENFILRFVRGQMWYWMAGFPADRYVAQYERDNRSVWVQELELTPSAKAQLQAFLRWNAEPEHRFYHYDYYRDNCSTRVRDAIDRAAGGALRAQTADLPSGATYRFHTQRLTANDPPIFTGLLLALGERVDLPISAWDEMFLPLKLREHVRLVTVPGPNGTPPAAGPVRAHAVRVDRPAAARRAARLAALVPGGRCRHRRRGLAARAARARERRGQRRLRAARRQLGAGGGARGPRDGGSLGSHRPRDGRLQREPAADESAGVAGAAGRGGMAEARPSGEARGPGGAGRGGAVRAGARAAGCCRGWIRSTGR